MRKPKKSKGGINREDFIYILQWILERPIGELEELSQRKDLPMWMIEYITALLKDTVLGRFNTVNYAFDMIFGKDRGSISVNIKVKRSQKNRK